ncbi:MAG TPA: DUF1080 domain-containing protein [Bacteroidales bacterium]|nr:DUF1080 domain-containing protein [Bacteroidales bacterium]
MKKLLFSSMAIFSLIILSCKTEAPKAEATPTADIKDFLGQWTIDIGNGGVGNVAWLEVRQEDKYLDGDLLWGGGSVLPVSNVFLTNDRLIVTLNNNVVRKRDENNNPLKTQVSTTWLEVKRNGEKIDGIRLNPKRNGLGVDTSAFTGVLLPAPPAAPDLSAVKFGEPVQLFNGKDMTGWRLINETQKSGWTVVDGVMVNDPVQPENGEHISYGNIRTEKEFEDFNLKLEVNVPAGSNSGVYLRGMYEIQVSDSYKKPLDPHNMGAVYSRITPVTGAEKPAGQWQSLDMTLCDRHATIILNGVKIIDNQPVYGPTGGAMKSDVFAAGPIYLQGDHGKVSYRNIVLTPIVK